MIDNTKNKNRLIPYLEHTVLKPNASFEEILEELKFSLEEKVSCFVVQPYYIKLINEKINKYYSNGYKRAVNLCTVIGFPLGYNTLETKLFEIKDAVNNGADEVDIVLNNTHISSDNFLKIDHELRKINELINSFDRKIITKVIIETSLLKNDFDLISKIIEFLIKNGIDFVKTSTGFIGGGAELDTIKMIKNKFGDKIKIKASGGIKTLEQVKAFIASGADKIGLSSSREVLDSLE